MNRNHGTDDTIAAIATALGPGGIGIVRLSGSQAARIADKIFVTKKGLRPSQFKSFSVHRGVVISPDAGDSKNAVIDEALLTVMRAPKSYTREDVVEISCHGGLAAVKAILAATLDLGARLAEPGEFTKRAFLNGRIDLVQAEAVLDIINAKTQSYLKVSAHQLKGELSLQLEDIREGLMNVYTEIEAIVNFPEDDVDGRGRQEILSQIKEQRGRIADLLRSADEGRLLRDGIRVVLCGRPNVGKSSLLNVFLKQPRAIVSPIAGTTRDTIEETAQIRGIPLQLIDTAGILEPRDLIEEEAVKRSHRHIQGADLVLLVLAADEHISEEDKRLVDLLGTNPVLVVINKSDLNPKVDDAVIHSLLPRRRIVRISALHKTGIAELEHAIEDSVLQGRAMGTQDILLSNVRHIEALKKSLAALDRASHGMRDALAFEFVSEEINLAVNALDGITGRDIDLDLLDRIFSNFCIGK